MPVLQLVQFECKQCVAVLKFLLRKAMNRKTRGLVILHRPGEGPDEVFFTGVFRCSADAAIVAAVKISREAAHQMDLFEGR
jgi:hypothetical protein